MHTKSNPQNSEIVQAVVDVCPRPSTSPRCPWCQGHGDVLGGGRTFNTAHDMGRRLSNASPTMVSRSNHGSFVWREQEFRSILVIPEKFGGIRHRQKEVPVTKFLRKKQESQGIQRNRGRNEKQSPRNGHSWNRKMQPRMVAMRLVKLGCLHFLNSPNDHLH